MFDQYDPHRGKWITPIRFKINPANTNIPIADLVAATMQNVSMLRLFTDLEFIYEGLTDVRPSKIPDAQFVIGFLPHAEFIADYGDFWAYANVFWVDAIYDANMVFNAGPVTTAEIFRSMQLHEWMHVLGFDHSDVKESILFNAPYHDWQYQGILRLPDIIALTAVYKEAFYRLSPPILVTNEHRIFIPCILHPGNGQHYSVGMRFAARIGEKMRFIVTDIHLIEEKLTDNEYSTVDLEMPNGDTFRLSPGAYVEGEYLYLNDLYNYGSTASAVMKMVNGDERSWELQSVEYTNGGR